MGIYGKKFRTVCAQNGERVVAYLTDVGESVNKSDRGGTLNGWSGNSGRNPAKENDTTAVTHTHAEQRDVSASN